MKIERKTVKSVITKSNLPEADYVINPYVGCQYQCSYCYADFMRRFTGHGSDAWGSFVDVKENAADTIRKIEKGATIVIGSVTDPYQPIERKEEITRKCLQKLVEHQPNLEIITKSALVLRDIDLLKQFDSLKVGISIGILDEHYARELEPLAPSPEQRLRTLQQLHDEGIQTYLFMSPIFPGFSEVAPLIDRAKGFVDEIYFENLNIRGNNKRAVMDFVGKNKPELTEFYDTLQRNKEYWEDVQEEITQKCEEEGIKFRLFFHHAK